MTITILGNGATIANGAIATGNTDLEPDGYNVYLQGSLDNAGTFSINSTGDNTNLVLDSASNLLTGGGTLLLSDNAANRIYGDGSFDDSLINFNNTIEGAGFIGLNSDNNPLFVTNEAAGIIDANQNVALTIEAGVVNDGLIEATGTGGLVINGSTITQQAGGTLLASGSGNDIDIENRSDIVGGLLRGTGGGSILISQGSTLDGSEGRAITIGSLTTVQLVDNYDMYLFGTVNNLGTLAIESTGDSTALIVNSPTLSLTGGGLLLLSDSTGNQIYGQNGSNDTLANVNNIIVGAGYIGLNSGNNPLFVTNGVAGIIDANQNVALVIEAGVANDGLIEATGTGGLVIEGSTVTVQARGTLLASGTGHDVYIEDRSDIVGGLLLGTGGGSFVASQGSTLDGSEGAAITIGTGTNLQLLDSYGMYVFGTIDNLGSLDIDSTGDGTALIVNSPTISLTGGGTLLLSDSASNQIYGQNGTNDTLANVNNIIQGAGYVGLNSGNNPLFILNEANGVINADQTMSLVIEAGVFNNGLIEATGTGGLVINGSTIVGQAGGTLLASGTGDDIYIENRADMVGDLLLAVGGGSFAVSGGSTLDGAEGAAVTIGAHTTVELVDNNYTNLFGTIDNLGTLFDDSTGDNADIVVNTPTVSLTGGGTLLLSDSGGNRIYGHDGTNDTLANVGGIIEGAGFIGLNSGNNPLFLINEAAGTVNADQNISLAIEAGVMNDGLLEASGTGGLVIDGNTVTNGVTGTIAAYNSGLVQFLDNADLQNDVAGTLTGGAYAAYATSGKAALDLEGGGAVTVDAARIILSGTGAEISFWNGSEYEEIQTSLTEITGTGTLEVINDKTYVTSNKLKISAGGVLDLTSGTLKSDGVDFADGAASRLIINAGSDLIGKLTAGGGVLEIAPDGAKAATLSGTILAQLNNFGELQIDPGAILDITKKITLDAKTALVNAGLLEATGSGAFVIDGSTVTNAASGTIAAAGSGVVKFDSNAHLANDVAGTLTGGAYAATGATLELAGGGALSVDDAKIILSGKGAEILFLKGSSYDNIEKSLTDISAAGTLEIIDKTKFVTTNKLTVSAGGVLDLASGTLKAAAIDFAHGSTSRLIIDAQTDITGAITAGGGTLELAADGTTIATLGTNLLSQSSDFGVIQIDAGVILDFTTTTSLGAATGVVNDGKITTSSKTLLTIDGALSGTGVVDIGKEPLTLNGAVGAGQNISFSGTNETLGLGAASGFDGNIAHFTLGDTIDLSSIALGSITGLSFASGVLTLTETGGQLDFTFASPGQFGSDFFSLFTDGAGTGITLSAAPDAIAGNAISQAPIGGWAPDLHAAGATTFQAFVTLGG